MMEAAPRKATRQSSHRQGVTMRRLLLLALCLSALFLAACQYYVVDPPHEDPPFTARFENKLYTDIRVTVDGYGSRTISPGETVAFNIDRDDDSYHYEAETWGEDADGVRIGLIVEWARTRYMEGNSYTTYLITNDDLFFLKMRNTGNHDLHPLFVNYGLSDQTSDDIIIPGNDVLYNTGYYRAYGSTRVQAPWMDRPSDYTYWIQGQHFYFPWTENQSVTLISNFKKGAAPEQEYKVESNLVEHDSTEPFGIDAGVPRPGSEPNYIK